MYVARHQYGWYAQLVKTHHAVRRLVEKERKESGSVKKVAALHGTGHPTAHGFILREL